MSQNTNNIQENSPKSFEIMANALGISLPEFLELEERKRIEKEDEHERIYPKVWDDSITGCYKSMMSTIKSMEETISALSKCDDTLRENGYPIDSKYIPYKQWGLSTMEQLLKRHQSEKGSTA